MKDRIVEKALYILKGMHYKLRAYHYNIKYYDPDELPKIVFVHVPKCGGSSMTKALKKVYKRSYRSLYHIPVFKASKRYFETQDEYLNIDQFLPQLPIQLIYGALLFNSVARERKCLSGHIYFNRKMINSLKQLDYKFITLVRNPVDRFFSHYFYRFHKETGIPSICDSFEEYLDNRRDLGSLYIKFFGGLRSDENYNSSEAIDQAIDNLKEYEVIGQLENLDLFIKELESKFGLPLEIPKVNKNPAPKNKYDEFRNSSEKRKMVKEVCEPDLKLFEQVKDLLR